VIVRVFPNLEALSHEAAQLFAQHVREAPGRFKVALAGGNTPKRLYEMLAQPPYRDTVDWSKVEVFFGDERWVPPADPESNEGMARAVLLNHVRIPPDQVFPMYRPGTVEEGAEAYETILKEHAPLDLVFLGMGDDGHTASLFPGIPELWVKDRRVVATTSPKGVPQRLTMTVSALQTSKLLVFLVSGENKAELLQRALADDDSNRPPSGVVAKGAQQAFWFVDSAAMK
jgi:6-phosphogluconolactonase